MTPLDRRPVRHRVTGWLPPVVPAGAVYTGRGPGPRGRWGNPIRVEGPVDAGLAVAVHARWLARPAQTDLREAIRIELTGQDLACWCPPPPAPCHADTLLAIAAGTWAPPPPVVAATRGLPGSGKSTWARAWATELTGLGLTVTRISRDDVRADLGLDPALTTPDDEQQVTIEHHARVRAAITGGLDVLLIDDTHLVEAHLQATTDLAHDCGAVPHIVDFRTVPIATCITRDATRTGTTHVGATRITAMATAAGLT